MSDVAGYHRQVVERLRALLGPDLVGVYAGGSFALGGYDPGRSDLDVVAVSRRPLDAATKNEIADAVRYESLPCPARGLELVLYAESSVREATAGASYELNLNTGPAMPFHLSLAPEGEEEHWFAIDRAILREHGVALAGPPPEELFAPIPRDALLELLAESLRWHQRREKARDDDAVLNACRAWRYAAEGKWSSKAEAGEWARTRADDPGLIETAIAARSDARHLDRHRVDAFLRGIRRVVGSSR